MGVLRRAAGLVIVPVLLIVSPPSVTAAPGFVVVPPTGGNRVLFIGADGVVQRSLNLGEPVDLQAAPSPDGRWLAFTTEARDGTAAVDLAPLGGGHPKRVGVGSDPAWSPDGQQLVFSAVVPITDGLFSDLSNLSVYSLATSKRTKLLASRFSDGFPSWSPDGQRVVFTRSGGKTGRRAQLYVTDGNSVTRLRTDSKPDLEPSWSPDGSRIAFVSEARGKFRFDVFVTNADGSGRQQLTRDENIEEDSPHWSADEQQLAFTMSTLGGERSGVAVMSASGGRPCLVYTIWGQLGGADWQPGSTPGTQLPSRCLPFIPPAPAPILRCGHAAALTAVDRSRVPLSARAMAHHVDGARIRSQCGDFTGDGRRDLVVLFDSRDGFRGSAWAAFRRAAHDWKLARFGTGAFVRVRVSGGNVVETEAVFALPDHACCPSGGTAQSVYRWDGHQLRLVSRSRSSAIR